MRPLADPDAPADCRLRVPWWIPLWVRKAKYQGTSRVLETGSTQTSFFSQRFKTAHLVCRYDLGLISGALAPIKDELLLSDVAAEVMVGAAKFGAVFGTFLGGSLMLYYGRRLTIGVDSFFFILGPVTMALSSGVT